MTMTMTMPVEKAKRGGAKMGATNAETCTTTLAISESLREFSPIKTWAYLVDLLGLDERSAKHRMAATRRYTAQEIAALLHTENGYRVLATIMAGAKRPPLWWRICRPLMTAADAQRMQIEARVKIERELKATVDASNELASIIERGKTAMVTQDEAFYSPHFEAVGHMAGRNKAMAGRPHRAGTQKARR